MDPNAYLLVGLAVAGIGAVLGIPLALRERSSRRNPPRKAAQARQYVYADDGVENVTATPAPRPSDVRQVV
jgi:hypothetical protein